VAKNTNFIDNILARPKEQKTWFSLPQTEIFEAETTLELQTLINDWIEALAIPVDPNRYYSIRDIKYTSAQVSNNTVSYSALVFYDVWEPQ
jgi:hypothetical protein